MYIPRKLFVSQLAARKKSNKLMEAQNLNIDSKRFSRKQNVSPDNGFYSKLYKI